MTPAQPSSSDGPSLPPRHRPNKGNLSRDTTESDLWDFDDADDQGAKTQEPMAAPAAPPRRGDVPQPRSAGDSAESAPGRYQTNVSKPKSRPTAPTTPTGAATIGSDFDDLVHWDDSAPEPASESPATAPALEVSPISAAPAIPEEAFETAPDVPKSEETPRVPPAPVSLRPHWSLSKAERVGLVVLSAVLLIGSVFMVTFFLNRVPTEAAAVKAKDFPIKGKFVTISSAVSYWRPPNLEGPNIDTFRRGTALLPVVDLVAGEGSGSVRVVFRNQDGESVGDVVSRSVKSGQSFQIAATAGFDDLGMHAAYRTGESKPWTIEVDEAPSENSDSHEFVTLFKMNISTDRRSTP
jgi:hypothetical protein